jgi:Domain of unknown function (DUF4440)
MKRTLLSIFILSVVLLFNSCDTPLNEYKPKSDDEKQIIALLNAYLDARNNGDINRLASMFHEKGEYIAGIGATFTKKQIAESKPDWWIQFGTLKLLSPEFKINGNEATVNSTAKFGMALKSPHICTLIKENGNWCIMKIVT